MGGAVYRARSGYQEWLRVAKISCWLFNQREGGLGTVSVCERGVFFLRRIVLRHIITLFYDTLSCAECLVQSVLCRVSCAECFEHRGTLPQDRCDFSAVTHQKQTQTR